jgi:Tfp pilus assembly protein PilO
MCGANKRFFLYLLLALLLALLLVSAVGVLRGEEQGPMAYIPMYLISEAELRSIEEYKTKSEAEKRAWLLQVQGLKTRSAELRRESGALNNQLASQQERNRMLQRSFNEYEAESLTTISMKNGEIADLKQIAADRETEAVKYKWITRSLGAA